MFTRREFTATGLSAAALAAMGSTTFAQQAASGGHDHAQMMLDKCAKACSDCQRACDSCATHCARLAASGKKEHLTTLATCQDCADVCVAAARIVSRGGPFAALACQACAEACARCGKECERFPDDEHMRMCAAECRKCEKECREMIEHAGRGKNA